MSNDDVLREKENDDLFDDRSMEKHWAEMETKLAAPKQQPKPAYKKLFLTIISVAAVLLIVLLVYTFFTDGQQQNEITNRITTFSSAIRPPVQGLNVPYETFNFNAGVGDTLYTLNGSVIIFPANSVLDGKGDPVTGDVEVRTREFNDPFDYGISGIPMDYDSAGINYTFISSGMIDINAYRNGEALQVNPAAKPELHLVSTNKERNTNLYRLDTVIGTWINKGKDEVNLVLLDKPEVSFKGKGSEGNSPEFQVPALPAPPQQASDKNPVINIIIDPASFKELLVYNGLKFEVLDKNAGKVSEDSKIDWENIELKRGLEKGSYKVVFSAGNRQAIYDVKPVLEGDDYKAAEKLYQEKRKEYENLQAERKSRDTKLNNENKRLQEDNNRIDQLNKLVTLRNRFVEAENLKIEAKLNEMKRREDSVIAARNREQAIREQRNRLGRLEQNLIRSFQIDGFGYWNCDQPTLPPTQQYVSNFKTRENESLTFSSLNIAETNINRIRNYSGSKTLGLVPNIAYFGWAFSERHIYYFTTRDFESASITNSPNTISIVMNLYAGSVTNYSELKEAIYGVNKNFKR